ncbi:hypothetical protein WMY93_006354 [Mugilogobius chulae]|uniref:Apolipoprotein M n=1 Tax=Mugilogobius chulae TaxID=88201 RepID=A0AAW0PTU4_9GOBI
MFATCILLLSLISLSRAVFPVCEKLVGPKLDLTSEDLNGTWAFVAGSLKHAPAMEALKQRDSITAFFSNNSDTSTLSYTQVNRFGDQCQHLLYNITLKGSSFTFDVGNRFSLVGTFLYTTCPDCLVMQWVVKSSRRLSVDLYLLSKRRILTQSELREFNAQLRCYQLPPPVQMNPFKELCPEEQEN